MRRRSFLQFVLAVLPFVAVWRRRSVAPRPLVISDDSFIRTSLVDWSRDHDGQKPIIRIEPDGTAYWIRRAGKPASGQLLVRLVQGGE